MTGEDYDADIPFDDGQWPPVYEESKRPRQQIVNGHLPLYPLVVPAPTDIRPRPWLFGYWLMRGAVTLLAAPGGTGKTSVVTSAILSCATGRELLGRKPLRPLNVAFLGLEESLEEMHRRFAAAMIYHGIDAGEFADRVFYLDGRTYGFSAANMDRNGNVEAGPDMLKLTEILQQLSVDVLVADPLALAHSAPENDNTAMARVLSYFSALAASCNAAVLLIHHTRKGAQAGDPDGIRGAGALINHARIAIGLAPMSPDEQKEFNLSKEDARRLVRIDDLKLNYSPRAAEARWVRLESVSLGNVTADYPYGDSVQVPVTWEPPAAAAAFTPAIANECLDIIAKGLPGPKGVDYYSSANNARGKAAYKVLVLVMRDHAQEMSDSEARRIIKNWLTVQPAVLREESYHSPNDRKQVLGLFVNDGNRP